MRTLEELLEEAAAAPVEGWDFDWFEGRASEERPPWGYSGRLAERIAGVEAALDVQTGGGEVLAEVLERAGIPPAHCVATESYATNAAIAAALLAPLGVPVLLAADASSLPLAAASFDLVSSRHPVRTPWAEVARVLRPGGTFLSQQIGDATNWELIEWMTGPLPPAPTGRAERAAEAARAAGLVVDDLQKASCRVSFDDVGAVAVFLRKVIWTVPGFTIEAYRDRLAALHERVDRDGPFVCHSTRFLIEAHRPL